MRTEELLIREQGHWVSAASLFDYADTPRVVVAREPKTTRQCQSCDRRFDLSEFTPGKGGRQQSVCQTCRSRSSSRREDRKREVSAEVQTCDRCTLSKPLTSYFYVDCRNHELGRRATCGTCCRKATVGGWLGPAGGAVALREPDR